MIAVGGLGAAGYYVAGGAFAAGLVTTLFVYMASRSAGRTRVVSLILTGIAVNAFAGGLIAFFTYRATPAARDQIVFWQMGSLNRATMDQVLLVAVLVVTGLVASLLLAPPDRHGCRWGVHRRTPRRRRRKAAADVGGHRRAADGRGGQLLRNHPVRRSGGAALRGGSSSDRATWS